MTQSLRICVIAGEASGDLLGGRLMRALNATDHKITYMGVGGDLMEEQGLQSLFPMQELSLMGISEVLPHLPKLIRRIRETADMILAEKPDIIVTIDAPDFCFRVITKVQKENPNLSAFHYVAPSVWAWRPGRAKKVAAFLDHLFALLPFEPPYFEKEGLVCRFIGHSIVEQERQAPDAKRFLSKYDISPGQKIVCLLPGSRRGELKRLGPIYMQTVKSLQAQDDDLFCVLPTLPYLKPAVEAMVQEIGVRALVIDDVMDKYDAYAASTAALAASGTVALELGQAGLPSVIGYRMHPITTLIAKALVKTKYASLINIVLDKMVMPEFLAEKCVPENLKPVLHDLLYDEKISQTQKDAFVAAFDILKGQHGKTPSAYSADIILDHIQAQK